METSAPYEVSCKAADAALEPLELIHVVFIFDGCTCFSVVCNVCMTK